MYYGKMVEMARGDDLYKKPIHPYTRSLLSAIPQPNPVTEKRRKRFTYKPDMEHDYSEQTPSMHEFEPEHYVYCSDREFEAYQRYLRGYDG